MTWLAIVLKDAYLQAQRRGLDPVVCWSFGGDISLFLHWQKASSPKCTTRSYTQCPEEYLEMLGEALEGVKIELAPSGEFDFAQLFVRDRNELDQFIDQVLHAIEYDAILWISYPKGSSGVKTDLNRDKLWKALADKGIRPVTQVSIDKVWSAMRFRPPEEVGR